MVPFSSSCYVGFTHIPPQNPTRKTPPPALRTHQVLAQTMFVRQLHGAWKVIDEAMASVDGNQKSTSQSSWGWENRPIFHKVSIDNRLRLVVYPKVLYIPGG